MPPGYHPILKDGETPPKENLYEVELVLARTSKSIQDLTDNLGKMERAIRSEIAYVQQHIGSVAMVAGVGTVADTLVTANATIEYWVFTPGGTQGFLSYTITVGVGFAFHSTNAADTSTIQYKILRH